jgi:hypothetical protein
VSSNASPDPARAAARPALDLERGLPTTPADVAALRRARAPAGPPSAASAAAYLRFAASLPPPSAAELRARPGPAPGPPFRLPEDA